MKGMGAGGGGGGGQSEESRPLFQRDNNGSLQILVGNDYVPYTASKISHASLLGVDFLVTKIGGSILGAVFNPSSKGDKTIQKKLENGMTDLLNAGARTFRDVFNSSASGVADSAAPHAVAYLSPAASGMKTVTGMGGSM